LWSLGQSNLFNADLLLPPGGSGDRNQIAGGLIFFGGGSALYQGGEIIGGLGISGDTFVRRSRDREARERSCGAEPTRRCAG
jgi:hypothetical protein